MTSKCHEANIEFCPIYPTPKEERHLEAHMEYHFQHGDPQSPLKKNSCLRLEPRWASLDIFERMILQRETSVEGTRVVDYQPALQTDSLKKVLSRIVEMENKDKELLMG